MPFGNKTISGSVRPRLQAVAEREPAYIISYLRPEFHENPTLNYEDLVPTLPVDVLL